MTLPLGIAFQGAARTVTGSRHLLRFGPHSWLFDCGLYQGHREEADRVNRTFAFAPAELEGVVVSHAHLDHTREPADPGEPGLPRGDPPHARPPRTSRGRCWRTARS